MNPKTREKIAEVLEGYNGFYIHKYNKEALAKICAIVDKEREGEVVVLESVEVGHDGCIYLADHEYLPTDMAGKRGRLVFIPEGE